MSLSISIPSGNNEQKTRPELEEKDLLRAAGQRGLEGLVIISSIMIDVGAVQQDPKATILIGFASLVAGVCCIAIAEYLSVCSQLDMEVGQVARMERRENRRVGERKEERERLLNPVKAAAASALAFLMGGFMPLIAGSLINDYKMRMGVVMAVTSMSLVGFGWFGAVLARVPPTRAAVRNFLAGWLSIVITFAFTKLVTLDFWLLPIYSSRILGNSTRSFASYLEMDSPIVFHVLTTRSYIVFPWLNLLLGIEAATP